MQPFDTATHDLNMFHPSGLRAEIIKTPEKDWIIPGGKRYKVMGTAVNAARPMFKKGGWK